MGIATKKENVGAMTTITRMGHQLGHQERAEEAQLVVEDVSEFELNEVEFDNMASKMESSLNLCANSTLSELDQFESRMSANHYK